MIIANDKLVIIVFMLFNFAFVSAFAFVALNSKFRTTSEPFTTTDNDADAEKEKKEEKEKDAKDKQAFGNSNFFYLDPATNTIKQMDFSDDDPNSSSAIYSHHNYVRNPAVSPTYEESVYLSY